MSSIVLTLCITLVFVVLLVAIGYGIARSERVATERRLWYYVHAQDEVSGE